MRTRRRTPRLAVLVCASALALAACGGGGDPLDTSGEEGGDGGGDSTGSPAPGGGGGDAVTVGSANFPGNVLLAELYAAALEADGVEVSTTLNIGSRETYIPGLEDGSIDVIPEYTGGLNLYFDPESTATTEEELLTALDDSVPDGLDILEPSQAQDKDAIVVTRETADEYTLTAIGDLEPVAGELVLGGPPEFEARPNGVPGLESVYGVTFSSFRPLAAGGTLSVQSLQGGQVDAANIFTTDPAIVANDFVVLEDPEGLFAAQQVIPLLRDDALSDEAEESLNTLSETLTQEQLQEMMGRVITDGDDPAVVAQEWVEQNLAG